MNDLVELPHVPTRDEIMRLEAQMRKFPQAELKTVHRFVNGMYAREITIPAGCLLTGMVHKTEHINIISGGSITVWTEDGMKLVHAPCAIVSGPGTKRVGLAHTETVWTTICRTDATDVDAAERELVEKDEVWLLSQQQ